MAVRARLGPGLEWRAEHAPRFQRLDRRSAGGQRAGVINAPERPVVLRTDFSDDAAWRKIVQELALSTVDAVDDAANAAVNEENVRASLASYAHAFIILADAPAMRRPGHPLLVVDLSADDEPSFRAIPRAIQVIESNLALGSMDFAELGDAADLEDDGVLRDPSGTAPLN